MVANSIERETLIDAPVEVVWQIITEPEQIRSWFTDAAELELRPGGEGQFTWKDRASVPVTEPVTVGVRVETLQRPHVFSFRWGHPEGGEPTEGNSTLVEFTLQSEGERTRLRVVESGMAALGWPEEDAAKYVREHIHGWEVHLGTLAEYAPTLPGPTTRR